MKSNFDKYIKSASCYLHDCPYGYDISCADCVRLMVTEHDAKVRADAFDRGYDKGRADAIDRCIETVSRETHDGTLCDYLTDLKKTKTADEMTRAELMDKICPIEAVSDCNNGTCTRACDKCDITLNQWLDRYDATLKRKVIEKIQSVALVSIYSDLWETLEQMKEEDNGRISNELKEQKNGHT